jgi:hypothetical protein
MNTDKRRSRRSRIGALVVVVLSLVLQLGAGPTAGAMPATCYSTDEGEYPCEFTLTDAAGSFEVSAPGHPSYALVIDSPGVGAAFVTFEPGGRSVALPWPYLRSAADPACWENPDTRASICVW